ncbi:biotin--[acetyl-CoA-carboxylase] ligase [Thermus scotoductus]|uniref:Bifunctional ligase/repressor BirA n=5 Tax=Thermus scotoductus TaxID=37636 RepID=A0A430USF9_THESC|nr:biotin--[acetyl-CoA-carboxylase] ligase [Thermus scotoductus]RTH06703.1 biotin--[acetyl-CoA-carboxylase] ligase [Thermus scotoductus]RTI11387.1 biotin--[acetyl-CoA-carboxylase] ligase [Thermus scotoductus]
MPGLLDLLTEDYQSGEALARHLGISRQAVSKEAKRLLAEGFPVEVSREGYRIRPGTPLPHLFHPPGRLGRPYRYLGRVGSTQDVLRAWAEEGAEEGALVLAEVQERGRGRRGRPWESRPGESLTFSLLLRPTLPLSSMGLLPLLAGLALWRAVGVGGIKWPNDLLAPDGRKLAGVLLEAKAEGEEVAYVLLGVGANVDWAPEGAAALREFSPLSRREVLSGFLLHLESLLPLLESPETLLSLYREASYTLGRRVRVQTPKGVVEGVAEAILPDGSLQVEGVRIGAGEVALVSPLRTGESDP